MKKITTLTFILLAMASRLAYPQDVPPEVQITPEGPELAPEGGNIIDLQNIVTTAANGLLSPLHSRMPVVLDEGDWDAWLDEGAQLGLLRELLHPAPESILEVYPVGLAVNSVRNNGPELLDPLVESSSAFAQ